MNNRNLSARNCVRMGMAIIACCLFASQLVAQTTDRAADKPDVAMRQKSLSDDYQLLEKKLLQLHEYEASSNPDRSRLLKQAFEQSQNELTLEQMQQVVAALGEKDWKKAISRQEDALGDLKKLLDLLESEDRSKRVRDRQDQVRRYIAEVDRLMRLQRGIRGQTEGGVDGDRLQNSQEQAAERARRLGDEIDKDQGTSGPKADDDSKSDESGADPKDSKSEPSDEDSEKETNDGKQSDGKQSDKEKDNKDPANEKNKPDQKNDDNTDQNPKDGNSKPNDSQPKDGQPQQGQPKDGQPQQGDPKQGQPNQGQPSESNQPPPSADERVRKRIQAAEDRMRQAQDDLKEAKRDDSVEKMRDAEEELAQAKKELEEILRQLRDEEVERSLAMLEGRFRRMLEQETRIHEKTALYDKTSAKKRGSEFEIRAGKLGVEQRNVAADADRALLILREDGSSIAFPETVAQMRDDMYQVSTRLNSGKTNVITQEIEQDIIDSLNDLIAALIQAQKDQEENEDQPSPPPGQPQSGQPGEQPLVDQIAELKMIRGLQIRINKRHKRYAEELEDPDDPVGFSDDPEIESALKRLSDRQEKVQKITRDIVLGKNK